MSLGPDLVQETPKSNIMQAGVSRTTSTEEEILRLKSGIADVKRKRTELLAEFGAEYLKQTQSQQSVETNVKQAGILNKDSDREIVDTMLGFMNGDLNGGYQPPAIGMLSDNPQQSNLKQAGIQKKVSDIKMLNDFLEFSGLS